MKKVMVATLAMVSMTSAAFGDEGASDNGIYGSFHYSMMGTDVEEAEYDLTTMGLNVGYQFNDYLAAEVRVGGGSNTDEDFGFDLSVDHYYGVYAKVGVPLGDIIYPYVVLGFTDITLDTDGFVDDESDNDLSYGIGVNFALEKSVSVYVEYMTWYDDSVSGVDVEVSGPSIGLQVNF